MTIGLETVLLVAAAFGFALSIGAHYTGACMGMPYAAGVIRARTALAILAPLALLGAALASEGVETTVGHGLLAGGITVPLALAIVVAALGLTSAYNFLTVPTSTIQIFVFSVIGAGLAAGVPILWGTIDRLVLLWAAAPIAAFGLSYTLLRILDARGPGAPGTFRPRAATAAAGLVGVGAAASFAMGANDVSNASGALVMAGGFSPFLAALVGGIALAVGVLTWGRPLLERVAFRIVPLDVRMATVSQLSQAAVILVSVAFGYFTSINQALVGAMIGAGLARRQSLALWPAIRGILLGWAIGPVSGLALGFALAEVALR